MGSSSLGIALVAGKNRVPKPAAGKTALRSLVIRKLSMLTWTLVVIVKKVVEVTITFKVLQQAVLEAGTGIEPVYTDLQSAA